MKLIQFAKHLRDLDIPALVKEAKTAGLDGYDFPVRAGYAVDPGNVADALPELVAAMKDEGMSVPMCTADGTLNDPSDPDAERIVAALGESGVPFLKLGYFRFRPFEDDYLEVLDAARGSLSGWEELAARHNVTVCYHTHSGDFLGSNAAELRRLIEGFDPSRIGAYLDTGHLGIAGEDFPAACAKVGESLKIVSMKSLIRVWEEKDGKRVVGKTPVPLSEGFFDAEAIVSHLVRAGFTGPVTVHVEYKKPYPELIESGRRDVAIIRAAMEAARRRA